MSKTAVNIKNNWSGSYKNFPRMKRTTCIAEITNQKNEKYLPEGRNPLACWPPRLLASCQLRNYPREFTEKCFAAFDQSSCAIYLT